MKRGVAFVGMCAAALLALAGCGDSTTRPSNTNQPGWAVSDVVVDAAWVKQVVAGGNPASNPSNAYVILEYQWGPADENSDYAKGHIPGAVHFNSDDFETGDPCYYLRSDADLAAVIKQFGITRSTTVVVYSSWQIAAARGWWILKYAGVEDVRFLDGGYGAWVASGGEVETAPHVPVPVTDFGGTVPLHPEYFASTDYMEAVVAEASAGTVIVDVRKLAEFTGEISGYGSLEAKGRIPGAVWGREADAGEASTYLNADGTLRSAEEIAEVWTPIGATPARQVIFYCGGGWRSSLAFLYAYLMGYPSIHNYSNGWFQWSTDFEQQGDTWTQTPSGRPFLTGP